MMSYTIITHFDMAGYKTIHSCMDVVGGERICRVPYGRVEDSMRYQVDTLPFHFTVSSSKEPFALLINKLEGLRFSPFELMVNGLGVMSGRDDSKVLYFGVEQSMEYNAMQAELFDRIGNPNYFPNATTIHMTLCISKDHDKINRLKTNIERTFTPFKLKVMSLGVYEIWPGKLMSIIS